MATIDVFAGDGFSMMELTAALENVPHKPNGLGAMGIFTPKPIRTNVAAIESRDGVLTLVQTSQRGAPLAQRGNENRKLRHFETHRIALGDRLMASELQGIRAFGSESELQQVQTEALRRLVGVRNDVELTLENMRLGAVQGIVLDADGSTLYDWFSEFGISQASEVDFDLDAASPASGVVRKKCTAIVREMQKQAKGSWIDGQTRVGALCGDAFFDDLVAHSEVRQTYLNQSEARELRNDVAYQQVQYGGITFMNYRGTDDGSTVGINTDKAKFFPIGAKDAFQHVMSPAESFDFVNTLGQEFYAMQIPDKDRNAYVDLEVYSYPLLVCTRPGMLLRAKRT